MRKIEVVAFSESWESDFQKEVYLIKNSLKKKDNIISLIHIGSTSVKGLKAKPIIDMLLVVNDINVLDQEQKHIEAIGYESLGENGLPGRRFMRKGGENRTHHIHAYPYDNIHEIQRHISFRNYLRNHPDVAKEYGELKSHLALSFPNDITSYSKGKDCFVKKVEARGLKEHWRKEQ